MESNELNSLLKSIKVLKKSEVKDLVNSRMREFKEKGEAFCEELFKELCFCILTANFNAERCIKIQEKVGDGFMTYTKPALEERLRELGHRFPKRRAEYIVEARKYINSLKDMESIEDGSELRNQLAEKIKGLGPKEASHFLRNTGYQNLAIIDFHIIDVLTKHGLIERPRTLTKAKYLEIEGLLKKIADEAELNLAELDLYLWYMETGKVLK